MDTLLSERNGRVYLTGSVSIIEPTDEEVASYANFETVRRTAPNDKLMWLQGEYVSSTANDNGQHFATDELAIKSLQPVLMPVTIMHDFKTAVGVIAHTALDIPEVASAHEPVKIHTVLAIWGHRFPEIAAEIKQNHEAGSLMQSMECEAPSFSCTECGSTYVKPVNDHDLCDHIKNRSGHRTLHNVTFTGSGLIFGTRGTVGANPDAHLDVLSEVAAWSDQRNKTTERSSKMTDITIPKDEYDALVAKAGKVDSAEAEKVKAEEAKVDAEKAKDEADTKVTEKEAEVASLTTERDDLKTKLDAAEAEKAEDELASSRLSEIPKEVAEKLGSMETTRDRLAKKARTVSDDDWQAEVASLAEILAVDLTKSQGSAGEVFSETAMRKFNPAGAPKRTEGDDPTDATLTSVGSGLATMLRDSRGVNKKG